MDRKVNVFVVGSGGREHTICWKLAQSPRLSRLYVAPGNAGIEPLGQNIPIAVDDIQALAGFALQNQVDLALIGPEAPLAAGLVDAMQRIGVPTFGPSRAAAQIEASKAFAKHFMARHNIPTGRFAVFDAYKPALDHLHQVEYPVVVKASGLAAGKGVIVPENVQEAERALHSMLVEGEFAEASRQVILEERLSGPEVSLLAFSDGLIARPMPPAQDHKRLWDGDRGPNTGGMGAYAPTPICPPELVDEGVQKVLQPAVDGLRMEGTPFVGVLYAGLMLTPDGMRVLEFNCRFGDPETQVILPLLETDLIEIVEACIEGKLGMLNMAWKPQTAACVVLASENYPGKVPSGRKITGLNREIPNSLVFHAGTRRQEGEIVTAGGRVLGVTGLGESLTAALEAAYARVGEISFLGMQFRKDIGHQAAPEFARAKVGLQARSTPSAYAAAGVDIEAGNRAVDLMRQAVKSTYGREVLAGIGAFGGLFDAMALKNMQEPVLVASTDGVGTKVSLAAQAGQYAGLGQDIVNHCINDILVQGARPLFFLDYFAASHLAPEIVAAVVSGAASACRVASCALLGGETAEMPGVYAPGQFDVAGTIVGVVERARILPRPNVIEGDMLLGLASSGAHTNGFSLIRKVFEEVSLATVYPELGVPLAEVLLAPHRSYFGLLWPLLQAHDPPIKAMAHITGGGFLENIPRVLPSDLGVQVRLGSWPVPPLFSLIQQRGQVEINEMYRVFNMGIGMVLVVSAERVVEVQRFLPQPSWIIGEVVVSNGKVELV